ncbi:Death-associated inhibitor of apoptosis 1 [Armadillidium nasatum]|uniref:Death-associated inhibitor of apoptosis 1 n=1 Tax=Armadillidium nasatum TaxID=96803 RepID=A0A5N5TDM1_9CRUS|nr:Death-associated inhibitor of apoptosis 1 [Armadillidium nasatum]
MLSILEPECQAHVFQYIPVQNRTHNTTYCLEETSNTNLFDRRIRKLFSPYHFSYEVVRRATFDSWTYDYINKDELAKAGFYCLKRKDHVQCYFCKGIVGVWEEGDRPLLEHEKHFPNCPLVQGLLTSNVPLVTEVEESNNLNAVLNKYLMRMLEGSQLPVPYSSLQKDSCRGNFPGFAYPTFQSRERRLHTLTKWPKDDVPSPEDIADAGFFYAGIADFVLCYYCGGGLFNWSKEDDPHKDHLKYYSHCPLVAYQSCPLKRNDSGLNILKPEEEDLLLQYPISQKLLDIGLSRCSIKNALKDHLEKYSFLPSTFMDCTNVVVEWEDKNRRKIIHEETDNVIEDSCDAGRSSKTNIEKTSESSNSSDSNKGLF